MLRFKRSLYGLKQSPRCWNKKVNEFMESQEFKMLKGNSAVYTKGEGEHR